MYLFCKIEIDKLFRVILKCFSQKSLQANERGFEWWNYNYISVYAYVYIFSRKKKTSIETINIVYLDIVRIARCVMLCWI